MINMKFVPYALCIAFLFVFPCVGNSINPREHDDEAYGSSTNFFVPENITLGDDAFHGSPFFPETWYAEAFFNNTYSIVFIVTIFSTYRGGIALTGFYLYRNGILEYEERELIVSPHYNYSRETPRVIIKGETLMEGWLDENGQITYSLRFENNNHGMHLILRNETRGWQGKMGEGWWLAIPELEVEGILIVEGEQILVRGKGYHDHNIFNLRTPILERGYSDGKFQCHNLSLVWGKILHSSWNTDTLAIVSKNGSFISIPQETLVIRESSHIFDHGHYIPTEIFIIIDQGWKMNVSLMMSADNFHHIRLPFLNYWRYHVHVSGRITLEGKEHTINTQGMMELMLY
jgi:hypothetical protein